MTRRAFWRLVAAAGLPACVAAEQSPHENMARLGFDAHTWRSGPDPMFLVSGEFHYFRVPKKDWRGRMELFRDAGGNAIATYIPWLLHEPQEGKFVFEGDGGIYDLEEFLATARGVGLYVLVRPGPYQYSELRYDGLPGWLCEGYPELRAHSIEGKPFRTASVSYVHPLFLDKTRKWFDRVIPILAKHTVGRGGAIALTQIDNEMTGVHVWNDSLDYNAEAMGFGRIDGRFPRFLRQRYRDLAELNAMYVTRFESFEAVRPIAPGSGKTEDLRRAKDYFEFYLGTVAEYARILADMMRERGIDTPFSHNSGGPSMNTYYLETGAALGREFVLGSDHYYNLDQNWPQNSPTPQYALGTLLSLETLRLMGYPPTVFEMPGGSASNWPPITPEDARTAYWTNLAFGMKGVNYYIFTGGPNPPGAGTTSDVYDYDAAVGAKGEIRPLYAVQKELGRFLKARPWMETAEREFDCRIVVDLTYGRAEQYWKTRGALAVSDPEAQEFLRKGVMTSALCAGLSPALCDATGDDWVSDTRTPVVVVSSSSMRRSVQERVVRFVKGGGKVLLLPMIPAVDERLRQCTVLADFLGSPRIEEDASSFPRVTVAGVENILNNGAVYASTLAGAEVIGTDQSCGATVAWRRKTADAGELIFLGFRWIHAMHEHERMLRALLDTMGLRPKVECGNPNVWTSLLTSGKKSTLFLMNLFSTPVDVEARCRPVWSAGELRTGLRKVRAMSVECVELGG